MLFSWTSQEGHKETIAKFKSSNLGNLHRWKFSYVHWPKNNGLSRRLEICENLIQSAFQAYCSLHRRKKRRYFGEVLSGASPGTPIFLVSVPPTFPSSTDRIFCASWEVSHIEIVHFDWLWISAAYITNRTVRYVFWPATTICQPHWMLVMRTEDEALLG